MSAAYIVAAVRTAAGRKAGRLSDWHPADLAAQVLDALVARTHADPALIDDVIMGCVSQVGEQAGNIARNAVMASKLPESVPGTSVDRQCGSSQQALHFAAQAVMSGAMDVVIAAGVESMSRVPMGLSMQLPAKNGFGVPKSPQAGGAISRHPVQPVHRRRDAGEEVRSLQGLAGRVGIPQSSARDRGDEERRVREGSAAGGDHAAGRQEEQHRIDEGIRFDSSLEAIRGVKLLQEGGRITAATSSQIADGASGVMVVNERGLKALGLQPMARIHHMTVIGHDPVIMLEAPIPATVQALKKAGMKLEDIDLFEVNEAFASVPVGWLHELHADPEKLNVNGGAIALGHPLGASGTKLMTTLVHALKARGKRYGLQTMCEGGGLSNVTIIERL